MKLELNGNIYYPKMLKGRILRQAFTLKKELKDSEIDENIMDECLLFVCEVFNDQFTIDDIYDHIDMEGILPLIENTFEFIATKIGGNNQPKKKTKGNQ